METRTRISVLVLAALAALAILFSAGTAAGQSSLRALGRSSETQAWTFSGRVYAGETGIEPPTSQPLANVTVELYGALNPYPDPGVLLDSTVTDGDGWYGLSVPVTDTAEFYHIRQVDPIGHGSHGATSVDGLVRTANWIEYTLPIDGKIRTGNKFWDSPWETVFIDDFSRPVEDRWLLDEGWWVDGHQLHGAQPGGATPMLGDGWVDYELVSRLLLDLGTLQIGLRSSERLVNETEWVRHRYIVGLQQDRLSIQKQVGEDIATLHDGSAPIPLGEWITVTARIAGARLRVYIDGTPVAQVTDGDAPLLYGTFAYETLVDSYAIIDNLRIRGPFALNPLPSYVWQRLGGPLGGLGYDVRIHPVTPTLMFVTDNPSGVNRSTDGGTTWTQANDGIAVRGGPSLDEIPIFSLTIDPSDPDIVWAGTQNLKGIYRSDDAGRTWQKRDSGVSEGNEVSFRGFGVHPTNSDIVLAGAEIRSGVIGTAFDRTRGKIYRTLDRGLTWNAVWTGTNSTDNLVRFILFDPTNPSTIYASTGIFDREAWSDAINPGAGVGLLKSLDGGGTWFAINNGIPPTGGNRFLGYLEMDPSNPQRLFAAAGNNTWGKGSIFRTTNGGLTWTAVLTDDVFSLVLVSPSQPNVVYAGSAAAIYRSDDGGDTWQRFYKPAEGAWGPPGIRAGVPIGGVVDPQNPMTLFINNYQGGNFKSTDGGQTWQDASQGYTGAKLIDLAIDGADPATVYAIGRSGPFRSHDGGATWHGLAYAPANRPEWFAVAIHPDNPATLLIADEHDGTIFRSSDGGRSWQLVFDHPDAGAGCTLGPAHCHDGFRALAFAPSDPDVIYAGMSAERRTVDLNLFPARASRGMFRSPDGGDTWEVITDGLPSALLNILAVAIHPTDADTAYVGTWRDGVYKTVDGGATWQPHSNGLGSVEVRSLAIHPTNPQIVFAGLGQGVGIFRSQDGGQTWTSANVGVALHCPAYLLPIGGTLQEIDLAPSPALEPASTYASVPWTSIRALAFDPTDPQLIYAADEHAGAYVSTNGGGSWLPINEGLTMRNVAQLAVSDNGDVVYAATWGGGLFRLGDVRIPSAYLPLLLR